MLDFNEEIKNYFPTSIYKNCREQESVLYKMVKQSCDIDNEIISVYNKMSLLRDINSQAGAVLDEIGKIVKVRRDGRADEEYRLHLFIGILENNSNGSIDSIVSIGTCIMPDSHFILDELWDDKATNFLDGSRFLDATRLLRPDYIMNASFRLIMKGGLSFVFNKYFVEAIRRVKAGGIGAFVNPIFQGIYSILVKNHKFLRIRKLIYSEILIISSMILKVYKKNDFLYQYISFKNLVLKVILKSSINPLIDKFFTSTILKNYTVSSTQRKTMSIRSCLVYIEDNMMFDGNSVLDGSQVLSGISGVSVYYDYNFTQREV